MKIKASRLFAVLMATTLMAGPMMLVASPAAAAPATQQDEGFKRRLVLANQLLDLIGTKVTLNKTIESMTDLMNMAFKGDANFSKLPQADQDKLRELVMEEFHTSFADELIRLYATEYANAFSEAELNQLVTTYKSPLMQKVVSVNTALQDSMAAKSEAIGEQAAQRAVKRWLEWKQKQGK